MGDFMTTEIETANASWSWRDRAVLIERTLGIVLFFSTFGVMFWHPILAMGTVFIGIVLCDSASAMQVRLGRHYVSWNPESGES
jgi:hypothetical protein